MAGSPQYLMVYYSSLCEQGQYGLKNGAMPRRVASYLFNALLERFLAQYRLIDVRAQQKGKIIGK